MDPLDSCRRNVATVSEIPAERSRLSRLRRRRSSCNLLGEAYNGNGLRGWARAPFGGGPKRKPPPRSRPPSKSRGGPARPRARRWVAIQDGLRLLSRSGGLLLSDPQDL